MSEALVVCMTHGRAGRVATYATVPGIPLCVAESQEPLYREAYPDAEYIVHPDDVIGIGPKRRWLLEGPANDREYVMMMDDDVLKIVDVTVPAGENGTIRDGQQIYDLIDRTFDTAKQMGAYLCGFSSYVDPAMFRPQEPFNLTGMVSGCCLGIRRGSRLWFPDSPVLFTDDLWVSALNAYEHRFMFQDMRYAFMVRKTFKDVGGMATVRTWSRVEENERRMNDAFGEAIYRRGNTARSSLKVSIQLNLKVPW